MAPSDSTCATQLLNAGCRVTSIQSFLGHKELSSTMVYARVHDQTVAEDYFAAMSRVEQRLEIVPRDEEESERQVLGWIEKLTLPELAFGERLEIARGLRQALSENNSISLLAQVLVSNYQTV